MSNNFSRAALNVLEENGRVTNQIRIPDSDVPPTYRRYYPADTKVDYWMDSTWQAPCVVTNHVGVTLVGRPQQEGHYSFGVHIVTPATRHSAHYLFCNSRNHSLQDESADAAVREWQRVGFGEQDKPVIEASARMMGDEVDPLALKPVLLPTDATAVRARRVLAKMIQDEHVKSGVASGAS